MSVLGEHNGVLYKFQSDTLLRPYRAPELLYGPKTYDPFAIDLWSLGATISQFFTAICLTREDSDIEDVTPSDRRDIVNGMILPHDLSSVSLRTAQWSRTTLFSSERGDIGLLWSIYSSRGTPNDDIWPVSIIKLILILI